MDPEFGDAALAIVAGDRDQLLALIAADPGLATRPSSVGHPTLLQLVAVEAAQLPNAVDAARVLVDAGSAIGPPLVAAAGCGSLEVLEYLLEAGGTTEGDAAWTPLDEAIYWAQHEIAVHLVQRGAEIHALSTAAGLDDLEALGRFFDTDTLVDGAGPIGSPFPGTVPEDLANDPQSIIDHAFVMAVNAGARQTAEELLRRGATINACPPGYHWKGTALHAAVWRNDATLVSWLMSAGADPTIRDGLAKSNAEGWAKHHGHLELLPLLQRS